MKLRTATPISIPLDEIPTDDGKINIDDSTQIILRSFLMEYEVEPKNWLQIVTTWYKDCPYISLSDLDRKALMEFTIQFKLFLLSEQKRILNQEHKAFAASYGRLLE